MIIYSLHDSDSRGLLYSELHGVWSIILGEGESGTEIFDLHLVLELTEDGSVDFLLELLSGIGGGALWGVFSEELLGFGALLGGLLLEGLVSDGGFDT